MLSFCNRGRIGRLGLLAAATLSVAASLTVPSIASATVPVVESVGVGARIRCGANAAGVPVYASHADKIVFALTGPIQAAIPADQPALDAIPRNTPLDIKVLDNPQRIADIPGKVLTFVGAMDNTFNRLQLQIHEVKYAMVCPTTAAP